MSWLLSLGPRPARVNWRIGTQARGEIHMSRAERKVGGASRTNDEPKREDYRAREEKGRGTSLLFLPAVQSWWLEMQRP